MTPFIPLFRLCTNTRKLMQLHAHLLISGLHLNKLAITKLIESYGKMGRIGYSNLVFNSFRTPDSFMWGVLIKSYVGNLFFTEAIVLYHEMLFLFLQPNEFIFPSVLRACTGLSDVNLGEKIHVRIIKIGLSLDIVIQTSLLHFYGETGGLDNALQLFEEMPMKDVICWSTLISSYIQRNRERKGLELFRLMVFNEVKPDSVTMLSVCQACAELGSVILSKSVHGYIVRTEMETDELLQNSLIICYNQCGKFEDAEKLFSMSCMTVLTWASMISCYNHRQKYREALDLYFKVQASGVEPSSVVIMGIIQSCHKLGWSNCVRSIQGFLIRRNMDPDFDKVGSVLINAYAGCGKIAEGIKVFESIQNRNIVLWNSIIAVLAQNDFFSEALSLFVKMFREAHYPNSFTLASSLSSCGRTGFFELGCEIHAYITKAGLENNLFVQNSLIDMYCKCKFVDVAYDIFQGLQEKDTVTWNSMITGFTQNGNSTEALALFHQIPYQELEIDSVSFLAAIQASSHLGSLQRGKLIHQKVIVCDLLKNNMIRTSLIDMYMKCGDINSAWVIFNRMTEKTIVSWSAMISGYGLHGQIKNAMSLFYQMMDEGMEPNEVTFMGILSACSHSGLVEEGKFYFNSMIQDFHIPPKVEHFVCMVDLMSRAGQIEDALNFIKSMPIPPNESIWGALLNGCHVHHKLDIVDEIQRKVLALKPCDSGYYALLSNIYAGVGKWDEFRNMRSKMKGIGGRKPPGYSLVEMKMTSHKFYAGDTSHPQTKEIYSFLEHVRSLAYERGIILDSTSITRNGGEESNVKNHSERLAVAFGIINTGPATALRISKNLRVCNDCHTFMKFVSKISSRDIIMRDLNRFHHFKDGNCSCKDYW